MIIRGTHTGNYTAIDNRALYDGRLSAGAAATLVYLMSRPSGWRVYASHIAARYHCDRRTAQHWIDELITSGYAARRDRTRKDGKISYSYDVSDSPDNLTNVQNMYTNKITSIKSNVQVKRCMGDLRMYMAMYQLVPSEPIEHIKAQIRQIIRAGITPRIFALYALDYMHGMAGKVDMRAFAAEAVDTLTYNSAPAHTGKYDDCIVEVD